MELVNREFGSARFQNECTPAYLDTIRTFISKNIVYKMAEERTRRGMFDALERGDEWDDNMDLSMGASGLHCLNLIAESDSVFILLKMRIK
jgi:DNA-directed RNA polymerase III subunit RPC1